MAREAEALGGQVLMDRIQQDTQSFIDDSVRLGNEVFGEFIRIFQTPRKRTSLVSR
jgi:hypothetical protein